MQDWFYGWIILRKHCSLVCSNTLDHLHKIYHLPLWNKDNDVPLTTVFITDFITLRETLVMVSFNDCWQSHMCFVTNIHLVLDILFDLSKNHEFDVMPVHYYTADHHPCWDNCNSQCSLLKMPNAFYQHVGDRPKCHEFLKWLCSVVTLVNDLAHESCVGAML